MIDGDKHGEMRRCGGGGGNLRLSDVRCKRGSKTSNENELERVSPVINWNEKNGACMHVWERKKVKGNGLGLEG